MSNGVWSGRYSLNTASSCFHSASSSCCLHLTDQTSQRDGGGGGGGGYLLSPHLFFITFHRTLAVQINGLKGSEVIFSPGLFDICRVAADM
jgi:hypothetical protein